MKRDIFWYKQPAGIWIEALPLGNGRMGAMVYGGVREETIQIDESSFWSGARSESNDREDSYELMWKIRRALLEEDYEEADRLGHDFVGKKNQYGTNMPVGNLKLTLHGTEGELSDYERSLSLSEGIAKTAFTLGTARFEREAFLSNPAGCAVVRMSGEEVFSLGIRYEGIGNDTCIQGEFSQTAWKAEGEAWTNQKAEGEAPGTSDCDGLPACGTLFRIAGDARETLHSNGNCGVHLEGCMLIETDGCVRSFQNCVHVEGCRQVILYIDLETDMFLQDPAPLACRRVLEAGKKGYECLKKEHIADVKPLYERMSLSLGGEEKSELPTDVRIDRVKAGEKDPDLYRMMFDYGRYLLIASSRTDSPLPTHMGGIWNDNIYNNIDCTQDMHVDMNLQMQYWAAAQCNLAECYDPYFNYLEKIVIPSGKKPAKQVYHSDGWAAHVVTNPWGFASLGWAYNWGVFSLGGTWLACLAWDYFEYTNDARWLKNTGFPILEGAAKFAADYVFYDEKSGYYMAGPSYSPENMFRANDKDYFLSLSTTCDVLLIREILEIYQKAVCVMKELAAEGSGEKGEGFDREAAGGLVQRAKEIIEKLPPYQIGKHGQLMEWFYDFEEPIPNHRHTSHLLGLYPFRQIVPERDQALTEAAKVSIARRHEDFEITSWGMNMLLGYYARMGMGNEALDIFTETFERIVKPNMASVMSDHTSMWCGTWELDGNTGLTSAMAEMLVQSFEDEVILLPALPDEWQEGYIKGIRIRGGHELNLTWKGGRPVKVEILAGADEKKRIIFKGQVQEAALVRGRKTVLENLMG